MILALLLAACSEDPLQPPEVAWDRTPCDHCSMLLSDPNHAAVLFTREGKRVNFDDPGCLFTWMMANHPPVASIWFNTSEGWLREDQVAFTTGGITPMGSGLSAVVAGTPGAISFGEASSRAITGAR